MPHDYVILLKEKDVAIFISLFQTEKNKKKLCMGLDCYHCRLLHFIHINEVIQTKDLHFSFHFFFFLFFSFIALEHVQLCICDNWRWGGKPKFCSMHSSLLNFYYSFSISILINEFLVFHTCTKHAKFFFE